MERIRHGFLKFTEAGGTARFGSGEGSALQAEVTVNDARFFHHLASGGSLGAAEAYLRGYWDSPDLTAAMRLLARNADVLSGLDCGAANLLRPLRSAANWFRRNTRAGSRRNIAAHYDLSNEFFALMLDPTMTYSSGIFPSAHASLAEASIEKYDRLCRVLHLRPQDHVLEIGTGWGGFAAHAARRYGCRVTTTTISDQQFAYAQQRFREADLLGPITLLKKDYRDLHGQYDKLVSIEMIEAVGERFLPTYFQKCSELLKPNGSLALQAILIPDQRYDRYRKSVDFIQRYVFPGGFLPSLSAMAACVRDATDLRFVQLQDYSPHYAETLARWRRNFWKNIEEVRRMGFDKRFIRTWHYYLCYCEAGFLENQIGVAQICLAKPAWHARGIV